MASNNDSEHTVYACANSVREEFYNLYQLEVQDGESWAEDQKARFQMWGANLGVFASGHASSDYRLRDNHVIVEVITQLLKALEANIVYSMKISLLFIRFDHTYTLASNQVAPGAGLRAPLR